MALVLWLILALVPFLLGKGALRILYGKRYAQDFGWPDAFLTGITVCIGISETAHLTAVFLEWPFDRCVKMLCLLAGGISLVILLWLARQRQKSKTDAFYRKAQEKEALRRKMTDSGYTSVQQILYAAFGLSVLLQIILIMTSDMTYWGGDMTRETVQSFLNSDSIYEVNPLTGQAYSAGIPLRLKILSLPTLYAGLCSTFGISPDFLLAKVIPAVVLIAGYLAYGRLAGVLFGRDRTKREIFLLVTSLLFWFGDYMTAMDGFGILHCGYRGTAIRAAVLFPYTICMCLRRKWKSAVLCIAAEACIVWTLYGMGACFITAVLLFLVRLVIQRRKEQEGAA